MLVRKLCLKSTQYDPDTSELAPYVPDNKRLDEVSTSEIEKKKVYRFGFLKPATDLFIWSYDWPSR